MTRTTKDNVHNSNIAYGKSATRKLRLLKSALAAAVAGVMGIGPHAQAATTGDWITTAGGSQTWATTTNWFGGSVPNAIDATANLAVDFTAAPTITAAGQTIGILNIGDIGSTYYATTLAGTLTLSASTGNAKINKLTAANNVTDTISAALTLNNSLDVTIAANNSSNILTLSGAISGTGKAVNYILSGAPASTVGQINVSGTNTYTGGTTIGNGLRINATNAAAFGSTGTVTIASGGQTFLSTAATYANPFNIAGIGWTESAGNLGAIRFAAGSVVSGAVTLSANARLTAYGSGDTGSVTGAIGDGGGGFGLELTGAGTLTIGGTTSNTYTGTTIVNGTNATSTQNIFILSKSSGYAISGPVQMGGVNTNQPNLRMGASNQFAPGVVMTGANAAGNYARFDLQGTSQTLAGINCPTNALVIQNQGTSGTVAAQATLTLNGSGTYSFSGYLRDYDSGAHTYPLNLVWSGTGQQTIAGDYASGNLYTGTTTVTAGTLVRDHAAIATNDYMASPTYAISSGAVFRVNQDSGAARFSTVNNTVTGAGTFTKSGGGQTWLGNNSGSAWTTFNMSAGGLFSVTGGTLSTFKTATTNLASLSIASGATVNGLAVTSGTNLIYLDSLTGGGTLDTTGAVCTFGVNNGASTFTGSITGTGPLAKAGTATMSLSGADNYTGSTTISGGTLQLVDQTAFASSSIANAATLEVTGSNAWTLPSPISGTGVLNKTGADAITLAGASNYSGATTIVAGSLYVNGTLYNRGAVTVAAGTTLGGSGSAGLVTVAGGGSIEAGQTSAGSLALAGLTFSGAGTVNLSNVGLGSGASTLQVNGSLLATATPGSIAINVSPSTTNLPSGTIKLIGHSNTLSAGDFAAYTLGTITPSAGPRGTPTVSLVNNPGEIDLVVTSTPIYWANTTNNGNWNTYESNWQLADTTSTTYQEVYGTGAYVGDNVIFRDVASVPSVTVNVSTSVTPSGVTFNNSATDYTLSSYGSIMGGTGIVKSGSGMLTIANTNNTFAGGLTINAGIVKLGDADPTALGTNPVVVFGPGAAGILRLNGNTITLAGLRTDPVTPGAAVVENANAVGITLTVNSNADATYAGVIQNGTGAGALSLTKTGVGALTLAGTAANTFTGLTLVPNSGSPNQYPLVLAKTAGVNAIGGNLQIGNNTAGWATVALGSSEQIPDAATITFASSAPNLAFFKMVGYSETVAGISGIGVIENTETESGVTANSVLTINNATANSFTGYLRDRVSGTSTGTLGLTKTTAGTLTLTTIPGDTTSISYTGPTTIGGGNVKIVDATAFNSPITFASATNIEFVLNSSNTLTLAKTITGTGTIGSDGSLTKSGTGTLVLGAATTYTGTTTVNGGMLKLDFSNAAAPQNSVISASSPLVLNGNNATLAITGKASTINSQTFNGVTLNPGISAINATIGTGGTINLTLGAITRSPNAYVDFTLPATGYISTTNTNDGSTGILGPCYTVSGSDWATVSGGNIVAYTGYTNINQLGSTIANGTNNNVKITAAGSGANIALANPVNSITTINSLIQAFTAAPTIDTTFKTLRLGAKGAVLIPNNSTAASLNIGSAANTGYLTSGGADATAGQIDFINNSTNTGVILNIYSTITDNGSSAYPVNVLYDRTSPQFTTAGQFVIYGINTYSGGTIVNPNVRAGAYATNAYGTGPVTVNNGGQAWGYATTSNVIFNNNFTIAGPGWSESSGQLGALRLEQTNGVYPAAIPVTITGNVTLSANARIGASSGTETGLISGVISDGGNGYSLEKTGGSATLYLTGNNTYSGGTLLTAGTLQVGMGGSSGTLGSGPVTDSGALVFARSNDSLVSNVISGAGTVTKLGSGTMTLTSADTFTGALTVGDGGLVLDYASTPSVLSAAGVAVNLGGSGGGMLTIKGSNTGVTAQTIGTVTPNAGHNAIVINTNGGSGTTLTAGTVSLVNTANNAIDLLVDISSPGASFKTTTAIGNLYSGLIGNYHRVVVRDGAGYYFGQQDAGLNVIAFGNTNYAALANGGALYPYVGDDSVPRMLAGSQTQTLDTQMESLRIDTTGAGQGLTLAGPVSFNRGLLFVGSNDYTISGNATVSSRYQDLIIHQYGTGVLTLTSQVVDNGGASFITKTGPGTLVVSGNNFYTGGNNISGGTLQVGNANALGSINAPLTLNQGGTLDLNGNNVGVGIVNGGSAFNGGGIIDNTSSTAASLTFGNNNTSNTIFSGTVQNSNGPLTLNKVGTGSFTFTGNITGSVATNISGGTVVFAGNNTNTGATTISGGAVLRLFSAGALGTSPLVLNNGTVESSGYYPNFTQTLGTGPGSVSITGGTSGFSTGAVASSYPALVNLGGTAQWGSVNFNPSIFVLNSTTATNTLEFRSNIDLNSAAANRVISAGASTVTLSGVISDSAGASGQGWSKNVMGTGTGTLILGGTSANTFQSLTVVPNAGSSNFYPLVLAKPANVNAIGGNLQIGIPNGTGYANVNLGASEQIPDTASISFLAPSGSWCYFKMFGFSETVTGLSSPLGGGVIEVTESENTPTTNSVLTVGSGSDFTYIGYMRDRSSGGNTATLGLTKVGAGAQTIIGVAAGSIAYTGPTTVSTGKLTVVDATAFASAITDNTAVEIAMSAANALTLAKVISGTGTLTKSGTGTLTLSGVTETYTGQTSVIGGTLALDFTAATSPVTNIIAYTAGTSPALVLGGGTLTLTGKASTTNSQSFNGLVLNAGASGLTANANATANPLLLSVGGITRNTGATVNFTLPTTARSATNAISTTATNTNGILGGYATVANADWATVDGTIANTVMAYTGYTAINALGSTIADGATTNVNINAAGSGSNIALGATTTTINTLKYGVSTAATINTAGGTLRLGATGGILVPSTTTTALTIGTAADSGVLTAGGDAATAGELIVINNSAASVTANATITDNGTGNTVALTKAGTGTLIVAGTNTYTGSTTIGAGTLQVGNAGTTGQLGGGSVTDNGTLAFNRTDSITVANNISGTGALTKSGAGVLTLSGTNSYTGLTTISAGTIKLGSPTALGATSVLAGGSGTATYTNAGTSITAGATLDLNGQDIGKEFVTVNGVGVGSLGAIINTGSTVANITGNVTLASNTTIGGTGDLGDININSVASGAFTLTKAGSKTLTLAGPYDNGGLILNVTGGTVVLAKTSQSNVHGVSSITGIGTGATVKLAGTGGDQIYDSAAAVTLSGGTLDLNGTSEGIEGLAPSTAGSTVLNNATGTTSILTVGTNNASAAGTGFAGSIVDNNNAGTGKIGLTKIGTGQQNLSGNNTYSGPTAITAGYLDALNSSTAFGNTSGITVNSSSTAQIENTTTNVNIGNIPISIIGTGGDGRGALCSWTGASNSWGGPITLTGDATIGIGSTGNFTLNGSISAANNLPFNLTYRIVGSGTILVNAASSYLGNTSITNTGALQLGNANALLNSTLTVSVAGGLKFSPGIGTFTLGGLAGGSAFALTDTASPTPFPVVLKVGNNSFSTTYSGALSGTGGSLIKIGTGTLTLSGANTYTGGTTISAGEILLGNVTALGTGTVTLNDANTGTAGTAMLGNVASGTIANPVIVTANGAGTTMIGSTATGTTATIFSGNISIAKDITLFGQNTDRTTFTGNISGTGNLYLTSNGTTMTGGFGRRITIDGNNSFIGNLYVLPTTTFQTNSNTALPSTTSVNLAAADSLWKFNNSVSTIDALTGLGQIGVHESVTGNDLLVVGANGASSTFGGIIKDGFGGTGKTMSLTKIGAGTLTLTGNSAYTGKTAVNGGTLRISQENNIGGSPASFVADQLGINGATLETMGSISTSSNRGVTLGAGGGTFNTDASTILTLQGPVTGAGALTKTGAGALVLSANNTYAGSTIISGGTLQVGNYGTTGSLGTDTGPIVNNGALVFIRSDSVTLANVVNGTGSLTQAGGGTLTVGGADAFPAGINITGSGGMVLTNAVTSGTATLSGYNSSLNVAAGSTLTASTVSVLGSNGNLTVNGSLATASTSIGGYGSRLTVNGSMPGAASTIAMSASTTLGGTGSIAGSVTIADGGVLQGGGLYGGELTVGNLTFSNNATVSVSPNTTLSTANVNVLGTLATGGAANSILVNVGPLVPTVGEHVLIDYTGAIGGTGFSAFKLNSLPSRVTANLVNNLANTSIDLNVTFADYIIWSGGFSSEWSTNTITAPKNWIQNSDKSVTDYLSGDTVIFDDSVGTGSKTVDISMAPVAPSG
ncbi:MAG: autotransporter-associated beta strand repeat-containing protein, partial [Tepidisphaeraceae bacterium]